MTNQTFILLNYHVDINEYEATIIINFSSKVAVFNVHLKLPFNYIRPKMIYQGTFIV